jgi:hypothetical protein
MTARYSEALAETVDIHQFVLDPLTVILRLSILNYKPEGTKLLIQCNTIQYQLPGPWQFICRYIYANTKSDLHYLYNPIRIACQTYLTDEMRNAYPHIHELFELAIGGLNQLILTYSSNPIIHLVLFYYKEIIRRALDSGEECIHQSDWIEHLYTPSLCASLAKKWTRENIEVVLNLVVFLKKDARSASNNVSLETIVDTIDRELKPLFHPICPDKGRS